MFEKFSCRYCTRNATEWYPKCITANLSFYGVCDNINCNHPRVVRTARKLNSYIGQVLVSVRIYLAITRLYVTDIYTNPMDFNKSKQLQRVPIFGKYRRLYNNRGPLINHLMANNFKHLFNQQAIALYLQEITRDVTTVDAYGITPFQHAILLNNKPVAKWICDIIYARQKVLNAVCIKDLYNIVMHYL
jgi:hypothetical protein